jgi:hypothetical protein
MAKKQDPFQYESFDKNLPTAIKHALASYSDLKMVYETGHGSSVTNAETYWKESQEKLMLWLERNKKCK